MPKDPRKGLFRVLSEEGFISSDKWDYNTFTSTFESNPEFQTAIREYMGNSGYDVSNFDDVYGLKKKESGPASGSGSSATSPGLADAGIQAQQGQTVQNGTVNTPEGWTRSVAPLDSAEDSKIVSRNTVSENPDITLYSVDENMTPTQFTKDGFAKMLDEMALKYYPESKGFKDLDEQSATDILSRVGKQYMTEGQANEIMKEMNLDPSLRGIEHFRNRVAQGAVNPIIGAVGTMLNTANAMSTTRNAMRGDTDMSFEQDMSRLNNNMVSGLQQANEKMLARNPNYLGSFLMDEVPQAIGSSLGIMAMGGGSPTGMMAGGAMANANQLYQDAVNSGASQKDANAASGLAFFVGLTEGVPLSNALKRMGGGVSVNKFIKDVVAEAGEEGLQEMIQGSLNDLTAQQLYDSSRQIFTVDRLKEFALGAVSGAGMGSATSGPAMIVDAVSAKLREQAADPANADIAEQLNEEAQRVESVVAEIATTEAGPETGVSEGQTTQQEVNEQTNNPGLPQSEPVGIDPAGQQTPQAQPEAGDSQAQAEEVVSEPTAPPTDPVTAPPIDTTAPVQPATAPVEQVAPEPTPTTPAEVLPSSKSYRLTRTPEGVLDIERTDGKESSPAATRKAKERLLEQYINENDFGSGRTSSQWMEQNDPTSVLDPSMTRADEVIATSENVYELADAAIEEGSRISQDMLDPREWAMAEALASGVDRNSFIRFGDKNVIGQSMAKSYFGGKTSIDQIAQSASMTFQGDVEGADVNAITPGDVVEFIMKYPNGIDSFFSQANPEYNKILDRMEDLLGFRPTPKQLEQIANKNELSGRVSTAPQSTARQSPPKVEEPEVAIREGKTIVPKGTETKVGKVTGKVNGYGAHEIEMQNGQKTWLRADEVADMMQPQEQLDATKEEDAIKLASQYNNLIQSGLTPSEAYVKVAGSTVQGAAKTHVVKQAIQSANLKNKAKAKHPKGKAIPTQIRDIKVMEATMKKLAKSLPGIKVEIPPTVDEFNQIYKEKGGKQLKSPTGAYGFTVDGVIYLNPAEITPDTPAHEYAHIWIAIAKLKFPSLYNQAAKLVEGTPYYQIAEQEYGKYSPNGKLENSAEVLEEAVAQAMGEKAIKIEGDKTKFKKFTDWMKTAFKRIFRAMGWKVRPRIEQRLPEMTFDELITEFAKDMLNGIPLGNVTSETLARAADPSVFSTITIDNGLLATDLKWDDTFPISEADNKFIRAMKTIGNKLPKADATFTTLKKLFYGNAPEYFNTRNAERLRKIKNYSAKVEDLLVDVKKAITSIKKELGENAALSQMEIVSAAVSALDDSTRLKAMNDMHPSLQEPVQQLRDMVDRLSTEIRATGMVGEALDAAISENLGIYLNRSYKVWDDPEHLAKVKNKQPEVWENALRYIKERGETKSLRSIHGEHRGDGTYDVTFTNIYGTQSVVTNLTEEDLRRAIGEEAFKRISSKVKKGDEFQPSFSHRFSPDPMTGQEVQADITFNYDTAQAEADMREFLDKGREITQRNEMSGGSKAGTKDLSIFKQRKDIAEPIRAVMGEYTPDNINDFNVVMARTIMKQAAVLENERFLSDLKAYGEGTFLFSPNDGPTGPFTTKISSADSKAYSPLNGWYTSPEILEAMEKARKTDTSKLIGMIQTINAAAKVSATVYSMSTHVRNIYGAIMAFSGQDMFRAFKGKQREAARTAMGYSGVGSIKTGGSNVRRGTKNKAAKDYYNELRELGVVDDNAYVGIIEDAINIADRGEMGWATDKLKKLKRIPEVLYQAPDDISKVISFENELYTLMKAYPDEVVDGKASDKIKRQAADIVRATIPTYSLTPELIKALNRFPLLGTFVSFNAEIIRTTWNSFKMAAEEIKSDNPVIKSRGLTRFASQAGMVIGVYAVAQIFKMRLGVSDEEEEDYRRFRPAWAKNSTIIPIERKSDGTIRYIDMSYINPWDLFWRPVNAMFSNQKWNKRTTEAIAEAASPFLGTEIGLSSIVDAIGNDRDLINKIMFDNTRGQYKIYPTAGSWWESAVTGTEHVLYQSFMPGTFRSFHRIGIAAGVMDKQYEGQNLELRDEITNTFLGFRTRQDDIEVGLKMRGKQYKEVVRWANELANWKDDPQPERADQIKKEATDIIREDIRAAERLGLSEKQIETILNKEAKFSRELIRKIKNGQY